jgi:hypothetical protein
MALRVATRPKLQLFVLAPNNAVAELCQKKVLGGLFARIISVERGDIKNS